MPTGRLAACVLLAFGRAAAGHAGVLHREPPLPCGWRALSRRASRRDLVTIRFSLRQQGADALREAAERVSDPRSPSYGRHLTRSQVDALTAPSPSDVVAVEGWLRRKGVEFTRPAPEVVEATISAAQAETLLQTRFRSVVSPSTRQRSLRAQDFALPPEVDAAVAAVYGVHGLPLPPREGFDLRSDPATPFNVTPQVIRSRYHVKGVSPTGSTKNRQAVAEFQGQLIDQQDLDEFFRDYVPNASSTSSKIHRYVGEKGTGPSGGESALDVDYIMGLAPGVLTEYWYWGGMDFCADLKSWTGAILASDEPPLVHSVSYGFQGDPEQIGCKAANVQDVDANFMKLAARGITIVFASGDSGSGQATHSCGPDGQMRDTAVLGEHNGTRSLPTPELCCTFAEMFQSKAWSWEPPSSDSAQDPTCSPQHGIAYEGEVFLSGVYPAATAEQICCQMANMGENISGFTVTVPQNATAGNCTLYTKVTGSRHDPSSTSSVVVPPSLGQCLLYNQVRGKMSRRGVVSGGDAVLPPLPAKMWPSWPASSPWVTSVGATRFVHQSESEPEMATDQFGSGGGFSDMFPAFAAQAAAAQQYLKRASQLPPNGSFPPGGRATPDVSALGEGYQVIVNGQVQSIGGTSASAPAFAAMVSLLNEARLNAGKPPMGYLNPWLYAHPEAFTDITIGTNAIGRGTGPLPFGFPCAEGWDPATGLGTPIFDKMMAAALAAAEEPIQRIIV